MLNRSQIFLLSFSCLMLILPGCGDASSDPTPSDPMMDAGPVTTPRIPDAGAFRTGDGETVSTMPMVDTAPQPQPIEECVATAIGHVLEDTNAIAFGGQPVTVSAWHDPTSQCWTGVELVFQQNDACPLTLRFGVQNSIWSLLEAHITSTPGCGPGWGSGKTYSADLAKSTGTLLYMPNQAAPETNSPSCTNLVVPIQLAGTIHMTSDAQAIDLGLNALGVTGSLLSAAKAGGECGYSPTLCAGLSCGTDPYVGTDCGTCGSDMDCVDGQCVTVTETDKICTRFNQDRDQLFDGDWNGNPSACNAGAMDTEWKERALLSVNLYRWLAGLPPLTLNAQWATAAQQCALMQHANGGLSHYPPPDWNCYTTEGANAAGSSNLVTTPIVQGLDLFMIDPGNPQTIGHRRWILSNWVSYTAFGSTSDYSCMLTQAAGGDAKKPWTAWPAPGIFPFEFNSWGWSTLDKTGWTIQSDSINFSDAQVTVQANGVHQPVIITQLLSGYGSHRALSIIPDGWKMQTNTSYVVQVAGTKPPIEYAFQTVTCGNEP